MIPPLIEDRRLAYEPATRVTLKRSGNHGDSHIYVFLGAACVGAIWRENEKVSAGEYESWRRIYRTTANSECWPTLEGALKMTLQDVGSQKAVRESAIEELAHFTRNDVADGRPRTQLRMLTSALESRSRDASVMTETAPCPANPLFKRSGGYGIVSPTPQSLSRNGFNAGLTAAHGEHESSPRVVPVRTRISRSTDIRPITSTPAACEAEVVSPIKEFTHSLCRCHRGGFRLQLGVARPRRSFRNLRPDAQALVRSAFNSARLVRPCGLHPRQRRRLELEHRQFVLRRRAVLALHVGVGRWAV